MARPTVDPNDEMTDLLKKYLEYRHVGDARRHFDHQTIPAAGWRGSAACPAGERNRLREGVAQRGGQLAEG
jgi:hypothetical protein